MSKVDQLNLGGRIDLPARLDAGARAMSKTMRAAVARAFGQPLVVEERPIPEPGPGQIRVKIAACGVCHTDLHAVDGDWPAKPSPPFVPGHEGAGVVSAVGQGVRHVKEGDRVGVPWLYSACGRCELCLGAAETLCRAQETTGYTVDGAFAEYVIADPAFVGRLPDGLGFVEAAPVLCAGLTVYKGLKVSETKPGDWVVIVGVGGLGHMAVQYAAAMGRRVAAVDVDDAKLALAERLGATLTFNARASDNVGKAVRAAIGGGHGVLVTAASSKAYEQALGMVRRGGALVLIGMPPGEIALPIINVVANGVTVRGSSVGTRLDLEEALDFAGRGLVRATVTTSRLEEVNEVLDRMRRGEVEGRVVLEM
jgi:propanol-preferring alcohol dehydrogenase